MRQWTPFPFSSPSTAGSWQGTALAAPAAGMDAASLQGLPTLVAALGEPRFAADLLPALHPVLPAASWSVYRTGPRCRPALFMSASLGVPDTTRDCWGAYLSGPIRNDTSWGRDLAEAPLSPARSATQLCHITAQEVAPEHRALIYDAHGVAERVSVVDSEPGGALFAINFYRHQHQKPFGDRHIAALESLAPLLLALTRKQIQLAPFAPAPVKAMGTDGAALTHLAALRQRLLRLQPALTTRELDVCTRLLQGLTLEGIAADLQLRLPTVKTYRSRAFARLGIHFRNELFARVLGDAMG